MHARLERYCTVMDTMRGSGRQTMGSLPPPLHGTNAQLLLPLRLATTTTSSHDGATSSWPGHGDASRSCRGRQPCSRRALACGSESGTCPGIAAAACQPRQARPWHTQLHVRVWVGACASACTWASSTCTGPYAHSTPGRSRPQGLTASRVMPPKRKRRRSSGNDRATVTEAMQAGHGCTAHCVLCTRARHRRGQPGAQRRNARSEALCRVSLVLALGVSLARPRLARAPHEHERERTTTTTAAAYVSGQTGADGGRRGPTGQRVATRHY